MTTICITGLTTCEPGRYEQNRGNMAILLPLCSGLRKAMPDAQLVGTIGLLDSSAEACHYRFVPHATALSRQGRIASRIEYAWARLDLLRASIWGLLRKNLLVDARILIGGKRLAPFRDADLVLFFNGDIFGDNARPRRLKRFALDMLIAVALGKPAVEFAGSPGPFTASRESRAAQHVLERLSLVLTREDLSAKLLRQAGVKGVPIVAAACPAFLLEPASPERVAEILREEGIDLSGPPTIGMNLTAHNFGIGGGNVTQEKVGRFRNLEQYAGVLRRMLDQTEANVLLIPHAYYFDAASGKDLQTNDYTVLERLYELVGGDKYGRRLRILKGIYSVSELKGLLGRLDLYVAGRMHSAIGAISQCVPTVFLAYGHKHRGIAGLLNQARYVCTSQETESVWETVQDAWINRARIRQELQAAVPAVKRRATRSFDVVRAILGEAAAAGGYYASKPAEQSLQQLVDAP